MGNDTSRTHQLTVENEEEPCVIKVSNAVVDRLKQIEEKVRNSQVQQVTAFPAQPDVQPQFFHYDPRLTTTLQSQQEKIEALKRNDKYWAQRINDLEDSHKEMHEVMEGEYNRVVEELQNAEQKLYPCNQPPCQISKKKVLDCYKLYPKQTMRCAKEVQDFTNCVDLQRSILIESKRVP